MTSKLLIAGVSLFATLLLTPSSPRGERPYFGDLHLHTGYSFDVHSSTNITAGPDEAYRYARGEEVMMEGKKYRREGKSLDFLAVTEHVEWMVEAGRWTAADTPPHLRAISETYRTTLKDGGITAWVRLGWPTFPTQTTGPELRLWSRAAWAKQVEAADRNYRPGVFTTLFGYEWTSQNTDYERFFAIHRNVIAARSLREVFTSIDSAKPEDLWAFLARVNAEGGDVLSIANHPESGKGNTFPLKGSSGEPLDARYAAFRNANEPVADIGPGFEAHPDLSPGDPFTALTSGAHSKPAALEPGHDWPGAYARTVISRGMMIAEGNGGHNPYRIGFIGTTDFHNARSDTQDPERGYSRNLTGAWAKENTREEIVAAIRRRETFATSGTRISLRFFGGWAFNAAQLRHASWVEDAYRIGVPMGGELSCASASASAPGFIVWAEPDSDGADLERLQVIKIWVENGKHAERVYDVASRPGHDSKPVTRESSARGKSDGPLAAVWRDPDFDPTQYSAYYLRALEVPSATVPFRERAWSSPIWYEPSSRSRGANGGRHCPP